MSRDISVARYIADRHGESLSEHEIEYMMWNETAYPAGSLRTLLRQIDSYIRARRHGIVRCPMCGQPGTYCICARLLAAYREQEGEKR